MGVFLIWVTAAVLIVGGLFWAAQRPDRRPGLNSTAWLAFQSGLPVDLADDAALARYARRSRWGRVVGVVGGYFLGTAAIVVFQRAEPGPLVAMVAGWFAGGLLPELFVRNRRPPEVRIADLDSRSVVRYVTPTARRWLVGSLLLTAAAPLPGVLSGNPPRTGVIAGVAVASVLVGGLAAVSLRRITRRAQPAGSPADLLVDEAIRALATTRVLCGWSALQFLGAAWLAPLSLEAPAVARALAGAVLWASVLGVLAAWAWVPTRVIRPQQSSTRVVVPT